MNIGFDAKRAFHNTTGLGHYSRTLIASLAKFYPQHQYFLFNPKPSGLISFKEENIREILPEGFFNNLFSSAWRSRNVTKDLEKLKINIYHGLSQEIPFGINATKIKTVVTIHDLIHERYPHQFNPVDVKIYTKKYRHACTHAQAIIAISNQTKKDLIDFYKVPEEKITVCYQSCNPVFSHTLPEEAIQRVKIKYGLPEKFLLSVGSIIERKNLMNVCKALLLLRNECPLPLVIIGEGNCYKQKVEKFITENKLESRIIFLSQRVAAQSKDFKSSQDFPAIYQAATAMVYPSYFEGFGIPVLEALWSRLPVITSNTSSMPEAGGDGAFLIDPAKPQEIAEAILKIYSDPNFTESMKTKGWQYAQRFTVQNCAASVMDVYTQL